MLALTITVLFAAYVLGPDAFSRFVLDFSVPRRSVTLTKGEEVYRAVVWSGVSLLAAYVWERLSGTLDRVWRWEALKTFFSGVYSEQFFRENRDAWFQSLHDLEWMNVCLLWRLYLLVLLLSVSLCAAIRYYAWLRYLLRGGKWYCRHGRNLLAAVILPRIAPWHLLLSRIYVREKGSHIYLDILTKMNILYQGKFEEKSLSADGNLVSVTLTEPKRFRREDYIDEKRRGGQPEPAAYWQPIPNNIFVLMGSDLHSINVRYVSDVSALKRRPHSIDLTTQLDALRQAVEALKKIQSDIDVTSVNDEPDTATT